MSNKYHNVVVDMSNLYHKAYATGKKKTHVLRDGDRVSSGAISESVSRLNHIERNYTDRESQIFCIFEGGPSSRSDRVKNLRTQLDPEYKVNRGKKDTVFYRGIELLELIVMNMSNKFVIVHVPGYESDDVVRPLLSDLNLEDEYTLLISEDMDWCRSLSDTVHILRDGSIIDSLDFEEKYGFSPSEASIALYKSFRGDPSDDIPKGVPGIREKTLLHIVNTYESLNDLLRNMSGDPVLGDTWISRISENKPRLRLSYKLVCFLPLTIDEIRNHMFVCEYNQQSLIKLMESVGMYELEEDKPQISSLFKSLQ